MEIKIVCGLPASGKSTYVKRHMTDHDLIYDYDELMQTLTGLPSRSRNHDAHDHIILFLDQMLRKLKAECEQTSTTFGLSGHYRRADRWTVTTIITLITS